MAKQKPDLHSIVIKISLYGTQSRCGAFCIAESIAVLMRTWNWSRLTHAMI